MNCATNGATAAITVPNTSAKTGKIAVASNSGLRRPRSARIHSSAFSAAMTVRWNAVNHGDDAVEPIHAVKSIRHRKHDDRQQEDQIEEDFAAAAFRRNRKPPMMAEPKHARDNEADHQRDDRLRVGVDQIDPGSALSRTCSPSADHRRAASSQRRRSCCSTPPIGAFRKDRSASTSLPLKAAGHETRTCFQL